MDASMPLSCTESGACDSGKCVVTTNVTDDAAGGYKGKLIPRFLPSYVYIVPHIPIHIRWDGGSIPFLLALLPPLHTLIHVHTHTHVHTHIHFRTHLHAYTRTVCCAWDLYFTMGSDSLSSAQLQTLPAAFVRMTDAAVLRNITGLTDYAVTVGGE